MAPDPEEIGKQLERIGDACKEVGISITNQDWVRVAINAVELYDRVSVDLVEGLRHLGLDELADYVDGLRRFSDSLNALAGYLRDTAVLHRNAEQAMRERADQLDRIGRESAIDNTGKGADAWIKTVGYLVCFCELLANTTGSSRGHFRNHRWLPQSDGQTPFRNRRAEGNRREFKGIF